MCGFFFIINYLSLQYISVGSTIISISVTEEAQDFFSFDARNLIIVCRNLKSRHIFRIHFLTKALHEPRYTTTPKINDQVLGVVRYW